jgi:hypothetical protein
MFLEVQSRDSGFTVSPYPFRALLHLPSSRHGDSQGDSEIICRKYWVSGLCPLSGVLKTEEQNVSEIGSISVFGGRREGGRHILS